MELRAEPQTLRLRQPIRAAWGTLGERTVLRVELEAEDGLVGLGEAAPLEPYDGVPLAAVRAALDAYAVVAGERAEPELLEACRAERDLPQALAAVDLALWDLAGKRAGRSSSALCISRNQVVMDSVVTRPPILAPAARGWRPAPHAGARPGPRTRPAWPARGRGAGRRR